jgi:alpha-tubulin suppressor-like RCC1 family protein
VDLPAEVAAVAVGGGHACARLVTGEAYCWGAAGSGQLGDGAVHAESCGGVGECSSTPVPVSDATAITAIDLGEAHGCALREDGTVSCWGRNDDGQLGDGTLDATRVPVPVLGLVDVAALAVGDGHGCALLADATVACWGRNDRGQLGSGDLLGPEPGGTGPCSTLPVPVIGLFDASALAAGPAHTCALRLDGTVWCWGENDQGQLGDGTTTAHALPVEVTGLPPVRALSLAPGATCAVDLGGTVWCWGAVSPAPVTWSGPDPVDAISTGEAVVCAIDPEASLWCWGDGQAGQLGTGSTDDATAPMRVE